MLKPNTRPTGRVVALFAACLLAAASAALSVTYAWQTGSYAGLTVALAFAAAALGGEALKPFAVIVALDSLRTKRVTTSLGAGLFAVAAVVFSVTSELGLAAQTRGDIAAERAANVAAAAAERQREHRANAELAVLTAARTPAELEPQIATLRATPGANGCFGEPDGPISRRVCAEVALLEAEAARARRRATLEAVSAESGLGAAVGKQHVGAADPLATAIAAYASAAGRPTAPETVAPWLALPLVLLLELGSAFGLLIARSIGQPNTRPAPAEQVPVEAAKPALPLTTVPDTGATAKLLQELSASGGRFTGGQRGLADRVGVSVGRLNEVLHQLADAGRVKVTTGRTGTSVALI